MNAIAIRTILPLLFLTGVGVLSRRIGILKSGDERVLSAYVYYFAMPALSLVNLAETEFTRETFQFMLAGAIPVLVSSFFIYSFHLYFDCQNIPFTSGFSVPSSVVLPFLVSLLYPSLSPTPQGERLALLAVASIAPVSVMACITVLELYKLKTGTLRQGLRPVLINFSKNPLILSILIGFFLGLTKTGIPSPLAIPLHMIGKTTSAVAIFMLGVFLYGRRYTSLFQGFKLSLIRVILLPLLALLTTTLLNLPDLERAILVLMHSTPIAVSVIVLSERYDFFKETVASLTLVSSVGGGIYSTLWLFLLGYQ